MHHHSRYNHRSCYNCSSNPIGNNDQDADNSTHHHGNISSNDISNYSDHTGANNHNSSIDDDSFFDNCVSCIHKCCSNDDHGSVAHHDSNHHDNHVSSDHNVSSTSINTCSNDLYSSIDIGSSIYNCVNKDSTEGPPHPATTLASTPKNTSAVVRFSMATTSSAYNWTSIDEAIPLSVVDSVHESFRRYNVSNVCDNLGVAITSAERAIVNDTLKQNTSLYHVLVDVNCTLQGVNQTTGTYVLEFVSAQPIIRLTQCGVIENGTLRNWLAVHNHATMCQSPPERRAFLVQPLEHTMHFTENKTASSMMSDLAAILEKPTVWHLFAAAVAIVVLLAFVFAVVVGRRRIEEQKRRQMERSILEEVATGRIEQRAREAAAAAAAKRKRELGELEDEPSPRDNPLDTEKALKEHDARKDVFTIEDEDD
ncbi:unnamed protein product [Aphanomyces euteiches]